MNDCHFDEIAGVYDESLPAHVVEHYLRKRAAFIARHCPPPADALDVGCGTGVLAQRLSRLGYRMSGVDPSEGMLAVLRADAPDVQALQGSGTALPFADSSFDLAYCVAVMHHVADPGEVRETLHEMYRVIRPGGRVLVWDHNPRNPYWGRLMARVPQDTGEERLIPELEITGALREAGARIVCAVPLGFVPDFVPAPALPVAAAAERLAERTPLVRTVAAHNVILAAKD